MTKNFIQIVPSCFCLIWLFLVTISNKSFAQITTIPDPIFEQELINLGIDSDGQVNGQILNSDAAIVTSLIFEQKNIHSFEGIEAFVNLDSFKIIHLNHLDTLILTNNTNLDFVSIVNSTNLEYVDLSNNINVNYIGFLGVGNLVYLDISNNIGLIELYCRDNNLNALDVSTNINLTSLRIIRSPITDIDVTNNLLLTHLTVNFCALQSLDVSANVNLEGINCQNNQLTSLDLSNNVNLEGISCQNNQLTSLDLSNNVNLTEVYCFLNELTSLDVSNSASLEILMSSYNKLAYLDLSNNLNLYYLELVKNYLSYLRLPPIYMTTVRCGINPSYLQICVPDSTLAAHAPEWHKDVSATYVENCNPQIVKGRITIDLNANCLSDSIELGLKNQLIKFEKDSTSFYFSTWDTLGNYIAYLDTGFYSVTPVLSGTYWQACPISSQIYVDTSYTVQTLDWSLQPLVYCPLLQVDISAPFLRMTGGGSSYIVSYCNNGTVIAQNAYVEVDLDPDLNYIGSTAPMTNQVGNIYTFNIGNVNIGQCGHFEIQVIVDTSAAVGQTHCSEAHIYPDSICDPNFWTGANIEVTAQCINDSIIFTIENVGNSMQQSLNYYIVEDNIMMRQGNFNLNSATSIQVLEPAGAGHTYRIWAEQESDYPALLGSMFATAAVEGCVLDSLGGFNTGFVNQYSSNNTSPFVSIDCQENIASCDPNDKAAHPEGYGEHHYIYNHTVLDYKIRFQNTGNDTAFLVVIRDTISPYLDPSTLVMGASSHPYTWSLSGEGGLEVRFDNILLVDSMTNEPASHGFFHYQIKQKANNPNGTIINNTAAIYFDYNPPIFTNTTFHEVGEDFILINFEIGKTFDEAIEVKVYPNPFIQSATLEIKGKKYEKLNLRLFDLTGRLVAEQQGSTSNQIQLSKNNLSSGVYIYRLEGDGTLINTGKIIAQ